MSDLKIRSNKQNRTVHTASIDEPALLALVIDHVAQQLGLDSAAANVQIKAYVTSYQEGSLGDRRRALMWSWSRATRAEIAAAAAS